MLAHPDPASAWRAVATQLRSQIGESAYEIWLAGAQPASWDGRVLELQVPNGTERWLAGRYGAVMARCAGDALGEGASITVGGVEIAHERGREKATAPRAGASRRHGAREPAPTARSSQARDQLTEITDLHPRYTFDQFVIGRGNRLAHAAALAVAEYPGQAYNPLFLHAPPGLGKTHLLHAIGNYVLAFGGGTRVRYTTVEAFTNHFISALGSHSVDSFKRAYRDADVLLIDDVQFLASKARTEEEFFHTFNALYETGRQLVLTCDRLPRALTSVEQRLRERFEAGLVADIAPPDRATRITILRKRAALDSVALAEDGVLELIADRITDNVRALEGALIRVVAFQSLTQRPIDCRLTAEVLDSMYPPVRKSPPSIEHIQQIVAEHFKLSVAQLTSASRTGDVAWPRQVAIHLARELTSASLPAIGRAFGGRNHATVLHACKRVTDRLQSDGKAVEDIAVITDALIERPADRGC